MDVKDVATPLRTPGHAGRIRWEMLLSHHPPCDRDRTFGIGRFRICTRCFGVLLGLLIALGLRLAWLPDVFPSLWLLLFALPVPAFLDFTAHESGWWRSTNLRRLITGLLFGFGAGVVVEGFVEGFFWHGLAVTAWIAALQLVVAALLRANGRLEPLLIRYEEAVRKLETRETSVRP